MAFAPPPMSDVPLPRRRARQVERCLDAVGHEGEGRVRQGQRLARVMREHEDRLAERRIVAPPALPRVRAPLATGRRAELAATHDLGADVRIVLRDDGAACVLLAALHALELAPRPQHRGPVVQPLTVRAEGLLHGLVRSGDVAVQRDRDVRACLAHAGTTVASAGLIGRGGSSRAGIGAPSGQVAIQTLLPARSARIQVAAPRSRPRPGHPHRRPPACAPRHALAPPRRR